MAYVFWKLEGTTLYIRAHNPPNVSGIPVGYTLHMDSNTTPAWVDQSSFRNITTVVFEKQFGTTLVSPVYMREWFKGATKLEELNNTENLDLSFVETMYYCFYNCKSLVSVFNLSSAVNLTEMLCCFSGCESLTEAPDIPNSVTNIQSCFRNCISLTTAPDIPSSITNITYCFNGCESLLEPPILPTNISNIEGCFWGCKSLTEAPDIPNSVTNMWRCFYGCSSLIEAPEIPSGVTNLDTCFAGCESLTEAPEIPSGVTNLNTCFYNCISLTTASDIPNSVTSMINCFHNCESLLEAPGIPNSVININRCFYNCTSLVTPPDMSNATSITSMSYCFYNCTSLTSAPLSIPSSVIDMSACFSNCTSLVTPPDMSNATSITSMSYCFQNCTSLTSAPSIPNSVTIIQYCFYNCTSLITPPDMSNTTSVANINYCFYNCINLTGVIEINSVTLVSDNAFQNTAKLIVLKGTYPQLSTIANQYSNVYVYSLSDTITGERNDDILDLVTLSVQVNRFKAGSNDDVLSAINVYKNNNSSALLGLEWFTDDAADPQPDSTTWNQGEGWYLRDGNAPNYVFVEQNNKQLDTTKTYYKALESFIIDESPKIFYTNIDSVSEDETTTFNIIVTDAYGEAATQYLTIPIAFYTMDVVKGGRVISFGQHATQDMLYKLLEEAPTDWLTDYNNYYQKDAYGNYIQLNEITAPSFETDTYYQLEYPDGLFNCRMGAKFVDMIVTNLIGEIKIYAGVTIPSGWLECDGTELNVEDYPLLFNAIGNTYGGDGITTFCLPDLRGRFPIGMGLGTASDATSRTLGQSGGSERVTLNANQMPAHTHFIVGSDAPKSGNPTANDTINFYGSSSVSDLPYSLRSTTSASASVGKSSSTGEGGSHGNMPPYLTIKYIIRVA